MTNVISAWRQEPNYNANSYGTRAVPQRSVHELSSIPDMSYDVGWICALHEELAAARAMFDSEIGTIFGNDKGDDNVYAIGKIHNLIVVVACLPVGVYGSTPANRVAINMQQTFPNIRIRLLVGIGGGIPNIKNGVDIRLGDVVVSAPSGEHGGVIQYMNGKLFDNGSDTGPLFRRTGSLSKPPQRLLKVLNTIRAQHESEDNKIAYYLEAALARSRKLRERYSFPETEKDCLYSPLPVSELADNTEPVYIETQRPQRSSRDPEIHYGTIASGNLVIRHAGVRDSLRTQYDAICVEMEAAGLMDDFQCLVIRGISDYADAFKNDGWRRYAAATSAAYAKEFLYYLSSQPQSPGQDQIPVGSVSPMPFGSSIEPQLQDTSAYLGGASRAKTDSIDLTPMSRRESTASDEHADPQLSIAELYQRGTQNLNLDNDRRPGIANFYRAGKNFQIILARLENSDPRPSYKEFVQVYNKLALTSLRKSHLSIPQPERLAHVLEAKRYSELAVEQAKLSGHRPRIVQMEFLVARIVARHVVMTNIGIEDMISALMDLKDALTAVKEVDSANTAVYDEMAEEDMKRLRARLDGNS